MAIFTPAMTGPGYVETCTCCRRPADAMDRTYRRCRPCYAKCPAIGGHVEDER